MIVTDPSFDCVMCVASIVSKYAQYALARLWITVAPYFSGGKVTASHCTATCSIFQLKSVFALFYTKMDEFLITLWTFKFAFQGGGEISVCHAVHGASLTPR